MACEQALAQLQAATASRAGFAPVVKTLQENAVAHPALVQTLAEQLTVALNEAPAVAKAAAAPAEMMDVSGASCTIPGLQFLTPRGRFDMAFLADSIVLVAKGSTLRVPFSSIERVLILEKPGDTKKAVYIMIPLAKGAPLEQGKQKHANLLLQVKGDDVMDATLPKSGERVTDVAPAIIARTIGDATGKPAEEPSQKHFKSSRGTAAVGGTFKVNPGQLFPLKSGFAFVEKPPLYLPYTDWDGLELGRSGGQGQTFDLKVGSSSGPGIEISMISRDEMDALKNYVAGRTEVIQKKEAAAAAAAAAEAREKRAAAAAAGGAEGAAAGAAEEEKKEDSDSDDSGDEDFRMEGSGSDDGSESDDSGSDDSGSDDSGSDSDEEEGSPEKKPKKAAKAQKPSPGAAKENELPKKASKKKEAAAAAGGGAAAAKKAAALEARMVQAKQPAAAAAGGGGSSSSSSSDDAARFKVVRTAHQAGVAAAGGDEGESKKQRVD